jgi:hypothetical protein
MWTQSYGPKAIAMAVEPPRVDIHLLRGGFFTYFDQPLSVTSASPMGGVKITLPIALKDKLFREVLPCDILISKQLSELECKKSMLYLLSPGI